MIATLNKRTLVLFAFLIVLLLSFSGCAGAVSMEQNKETNAEKTILTQETPTAFDGQTSPEDRPLIPVHEFDVDTIEQAVSSEIKWAYYQKLSNEATGELPISPEDLFISWYYGNFGGCEVVMIDGDDISYTTAYRPVEVAGYTIVFASGEPVWVYKDGQLFTVKEAYDTGVISKSDVYTIGEKVDSDFTSHYPTP